jgi:predicted CoA-binding protein
MIDEHVSSAPRPRRDDGVTSDAGADSRARRERESLRLQELIDFGEGRLQIPVLDAAGMAELFRSSRRIAMIGASSNPTRPSNGVFRYLRAVGYEVVPISPTETAVEGVTAYPTLAEAVAATGPFDIVDVFRRPEFCAEHAREAVAAKARCLWLQLGIVSVAAADIALAGGLQLVMDRCTKVEHARLTR